MKSNAQKLLPASLLLLLAFVLLPLTVAAESAEGAAPAAGLDLSLLLSQNLGPTVTLPVLLFAALGLLEAFFGYRLLKVELFGTGLLLGGIFGNFLVSSGVFNAYLTSPWMGWVAILIFALLGAWIACKLFRTTLFLALFGASFYIGYGLLSVYLGSPLIALVVAILEAFVVASIGMRLVRGVVIVVTAALGGYLVSMALSGLLPILHINLILLALVGVLGAIVQFKRKK
ncbi:MAG: DUF4203 domain-containing protein [Clostridia bacterium]|nr:DUF4203 domain-containing protein [Clostridia bacterium]